MNRYECLRCGFKWVPKTDRIPNRCVYCSKKEIQVAKQAQELIDEI